MAEAVTKVDETKQNTAWAIEIAKHVELKNVLLLRSSVATQRQDIAAKVTGEVNITAKAVFPPDQEGKRRVFIVEAGVALKGREAKDPAVQLYEVSSTFALLYVLDDAAKELPDAAFEAFAQLNGMMNAYPYLREHVQSTVQKMGFQQVVLPVFRVTKMPLPKKAAKS